MEAEQEVKIILDESEEAIKSLKGTSNEEIIEEKLDALKECILLLSKKIDENSEYITEIYKEISMLKEST